MSLAPLVLGVVLLALAAWFVFGREYIVARGRARSVGGRGQSSTPLLVLGVVLALAGIVQLVLAFR
jgi:hypothetical protein